MLRLVHRLYCRLSDRSTLFKTNAFRGLVQYSLVSFLPRVVVVSSFERQHHCYCCAGSCDSLHVEGHGEGEGT